MLQGSWLIPIVIATVIFLWGLYLVIRGLFGKEFATHFFYGLFIAFIGVVIFVITAVLYYLANYLVHIGIGLIILIALGIIYSFCLRFLRTNMKEV